MKFSLRFASSLVLLAAVGCSTDTKSNSAPPPPPAAAPVAKEKPPEPAPAPAPKAVDPKDAQFVADLQTMCKIATEVDADTKIPNERKAQIMVGRFMAAKPGEEFVATMRDLSGQLPSERAPSLKAAAAQHGLPDFSCPAMEKEYH